MIQKVLLLTHLATVVRVIVPISFELGCAQKAVNGYSQQQQQK